MSSLRTAVLGLALIASCTTSNAKLDAFSIPKESTDSEGWTIMRIPPGPGTVTAQGPQADQSTSDRPYTLPLQASAIQPHCLTTCLSPLQLTGATDCSEAYMTDECVCLKRPVAVEAAITSCVSAACPHDASPSPSFLGVSGSDPALLHNIVSATRVFRDYCTSAYGANSMNSAYSVDSSRSGLQYTGPAVYTPAADGTGAGATGLGGFTGLPTAPAPAPTTAGVVNPGTGADTALPTSSEFPVDPVTGVGGGSPGDLATPSVAPAPPPPVGGGAVPQRPRMFDELVLYMGLACVGFVVFAGVF